MEQLPASAALDLLRGTGSAAACAVSALRRDNMESGGDMSNVLTW